MNPTLNAIATYGPLFCSVIIYFVGYIVLRREYLGPKQPIRQKVRAIAFNGACIIIALTLSALSIVLLDLNLLWFLIPVLMIVGIYHQNNLLR